ncbi:unnamed protein product, partial [Rotaria magnacalcarata]
YGHRIFASSSCHFPSGSDRKLGVSGEFPGGILRQESSSWVAAFNNIILPEFENYFNKITKDDESGSESNDEESDDCGSDGNKRLQANEVDDSAYQTSLNSPAEEEFMRLPCFSHSLQLVVNDGIKASGTALSCLKKVA